MSSCAPRSEVSAPALRRSNPRVQGLVGLTDAIAWFASREQHVSLPLIDSQPYDLVVDDGSRLLRVQVKTTTYRGRSGAYVVQLCTRGGNQSFHTTKAFDPSSCELLYVLTGSADRYLIPTAEIRARSGLTLGARCERWRITARAAAPRDPPPAAPAATSPAR